MNSRRLFSALALGLGLILTVLGVLRGVALADPGTRYVAPGGNCGGATPCYATVQAAVDAAGDGDEIRVAAGAYTDIHVRDSITQVVYISKTVTIRGGYTNTNWNISDLATNPTALDAQGQGRVLVIAGIIAPTVEGLQITGGDATVAGDWWGSSGGGIYVRAATAVISGNLVYSNTAGGWGGGVYLYHSDATLSSNKVTTNSAAAYGGGLAMEGGAPTVRDSVVMGNNAVGGGGLQSYWSDVSLNANTVRNNSTSSFGGGLSLEGGAPTLDGNLVMGNTTRFVGGGLFLRHSASTFNNNVVADNQADWDSGSGLYIDASNPRLLHTTIARNSGGDGSGIYITGYWWDTTYYSSTVVMTNTILISHTVGITVTAGNTATLNATLWHANGTNTGGAGSISMANDHTGDPHFAADGYHLTSGSAAIDKGVDAGVTTDIDGDARPQRSGYDIGADEYREWRTYLPLLRRQSLP